MIATKIRQPHLTVILPLWTSPNQGQSYTTVENQKSLETGTLKKLVARLRDWTDVFDGRVGVIAAAARYAALAHGLHRVQLPPHGRQLRLLRAQPLRLLLRVLRLRM